jgi:hypothetical protein
MCLPRLFIIYFLGNALLNIIEFFTYPEHIINTQQYFTFTDLQLTLLSAFYYHICHLFRNIFDNFTSSKYINNIL